MRLLRTRVHAYVALVFLGCVVTAVIVMVMLPRGPVTRANFEKVELGMSMADVERLLGLPDYENRMVEGPDGDIPPQELGHGDCILRVWTSPGVNFIVIANPAGRVVKREIVEMGNNLWDRVWYWITEVSMR